MSTAHDLSSPVRISASSRRRPFERQHLAVGFAAAGLGFKLTGGPLASASTEIFQLDIQQSNRREYFRIWPGSPTNAIEVTSVDRARRQLVLRVREARRKFTVWRNKPLRFDQPEDRVIHETNTMALVERFTPDEVRLYLLGMDDLHGFIARFEGEPTVQGAHRGLAPAIVRRIERFMPGSVRRQGEWFFVPMGRAERARMDEHLRSGQARITSQTGLGDKRAPRPHVAEEVVRIWRHRREHRALPREIVYARGWVRHVDHHPIMLPVWRRVVENLAIREGFERGPKRVRWVD